MLDWRALPPRLAATLAAGLPEGSRSLLKLRGWPIPTPTQLLASMADSLLRLEWRAFGTGGCGPKSILAQLMDLPETGGGVQSFATGKEFDAACAALKGG